MLDHRYQQPVASEEANILVGVGVCPRGRQSSRRSIPVGVVGGTSEDVRELVQHGRGLALLATAGGDGAQLPEYGARGHAAGRGLGVGDGVGGADAEEVGARVGAGPGGGGRGLGGEGPEARGDVAAGRGRRGAEVFVELGRRAAGGGAGGAGGQALGGGDGVAQGRQLGAGARDDADALLQGQGLDVHCFWHGGGDGLLDVEVQGVGLKLVDTLQLGVVDASECNLAVEGDGVVTTLDCIYGIGSVLVQYVPSCSRVTHKEQGC